MALMTMKTFYYEGNTYFLQLNTEDDCVRLYKNGRSPEMVLLFDNNLNVYDAKGYQVGTLCINDDQVQGWFIDGTKVADGFDLYDAERQFSRNYLKHRPSVPFAVVRIESSDAFKAIEQFKLIRPETAETRRIRELEQDLGLARLTIEQLKKRAEDAEAAYTKLEAQYLQKIGHRSNKHDIHVISRGLTDTALNNGYYGSALRLAKDLPGLNDDDRAVITRFIVGRIRPMDHIALQDVANKILKI